jgi:hypothetical protein
MLAIRNDQIAALERARLAVFEDKMIEHMQRVYPDWARTLQREDQRAFVRQGMERARSHGFETELEVARYLHVMHDLGPDFDRSLRHPWAADLLNDAQLTASEKMARLLDAAYYQVEAQRLLTPR